LTAEDLQEVTSNDLSTVIKAKKKLNKKIKEFREAFTLNTDDKWHELTDQQIKSILHKKEQNIAKNFTENKLG